MRLLRLEDSGVCQVFNSSHWRNRWCILLIVFNAGHHIDDDYSRRFICPHCWHRYYKKIQKNWLRITDFSFFEGLVWWWKSQAILVLTRRTAKENWSWISNPQREKGVQGSNFNEKPNWKFVIPWNYCIKPFFFWLLSAINT